MVESVGSQIGSVAKLLGRTVHPAAPASAIAPAAPAVAGGDEARLAATEVARELAAAAPVDHVRVAQLKRAIADGSYPLAPEAVADAMIALARDGKPAA